MLHKYFSDYPEAMSRSVIEQDLLYTFTSIEGEIVMVKQEAGEDLGENSELIHKNGEGLEVEEITAEETKNLLR